MDKAILCSDDVVITIKVDVFASLFLRGIIYLEDGIAHSKWSSDIILSL